MALVGPSGCGKTTLVNVLNGAQKFEGNVVVDGQQINLFNQKDRLKYRMSTIAVCYQDAILFDDLSVSENILLKLDFLSDNFQKTANGSCRSATQSFAFVSSQRSKESISFGWRKKQG